MPSSGRPPRLDDSRQAAFKALFLRGSDAERDGVSCCRDQDLCRFVAIGFGVGWSRNGILRLVHDLGRWRGSDLLCLVAAPENALAVGQLVIARFRGTAQRRLIDPTRGHCQRHQELIRWGREELAPLGS